MKANEQVGAHQIHIACHPEQSEGSMYFASGALVLSGCTDPSRKERAQDEKRSSR
jgi:hypothetical protein